MTVANCRERKINGNACAGDYNYIQLSPIIIYILYVILHEHRKPYFTAGLKLILKIADADTRAV